MSDFLYRACWVVIGVAGAITFTMLVLGLLGVGS